MTEQILTMWVDGCFSYQFDGKKTSKAKKISFSELADLLVDKDFKTELAYSDGLKQHYLVYSYPVQDIS